MRGNAFVLCASALAFAAMMVSATQPDIQFQRREYRHNSLLRMRLKRGEQGITGGHALKPRFTPPAVILPIENVNIPNSSPGVNTPDNV